MANILIIDDDPGFGAGLAETVADFGHRAVLAPGFRNGLECSGSEDFGLIFLDLRLPDGDGLELLAQIKAGSRNPETPVVILTAFASGSNTIEAMRLGAFDHLTKPIGREDVRQLLERALARPGSLAPLAGPDAGAESMIGSSAPFRDVQKRIGIAASSRDATVLITGETGTGKELVARAIHRHSGRAAQPFVALNCSAIPAELLESELFGHVRGAFSGALQARPGKFLEAAGGTLFLDEIGEMSLAMQSKMLRVLQDRIVTPVGGSGGQAVDVRILSATHRDLPGMVRDASFREDLFYRLKVLPIHLPPLRERGFDVLLLAQHFLDRTDPPKRLGTEAAKALLEHAWPGNVRELENLMGRLALAVRGPVITREDLELEPAPAGAADTLEELLQMDFRQAIGRLEKRLLANALGAAGGNRSEAARKLGINRQLLYAKMLEHGLGD
jgi:DNA-binding NtrC family response regulator